MHTDPPVARTEGTPPTGRHGYPVQVAPFLIGVLSGLVLGYALAHFPLLKWFFGRHMGPMTISELTTALHATEERATSAEIARRVDSEALQQLEISTKALEAKLQSQGQELSFYRGIVNPADGTEGLRVQRLQILPGIAPHTFRARLVLMQAARQDAMVTASAELSLQGLKAGRLIGLPFAKISASPRPMAFAFRYFQELETEIRLPADFLPQRVEVTVRPAKGHAMLHQTYPWMVEIG